MSIELEELKTRLIDEKIVELRNVLYDKGILSGYHQGVLDYLEGVHSEVLKNLCQDLGAALPYLKRTLKP